VSDPIQRLFEEVRRACTPAIWSRGVELVRADAVLGESADDEEVVFRVSTRGGMISPKVTLFIDDADWDCECPSRIDACEHVAAATVALKRSREAGEDLPRQQRPAGTVRYLFTRQPNGLHLERAIVCDDEVIPLVATLLAVTERRVEGPRVVATQEDLAAELALGTHRRGLLPQPIVERVLQRLAVCRDVRLDDEPIEVSARPLSARAVVEDRGDGFVLRLGAPIEVDERFANRIVRCAGVLRMPSEPKLTARERRDLDAGDYYSPDRVSELVTDRLVALRGRIEIDVRTDRLPRAVAVPPRIVLNLARADQTLSVLPTLVYGDPPQARIDGGRLVHLGGELPLRDEKAERAELRRLAELGLQLGARVEFEGLEAVAFSSRLESWQESVHGDGREHFRLAPPLEASVTLDDEAFDVQFTTRVEGGGASRAAQASSDDVFAAWRAGESLVPLMGGGWAQIPSDWLERLGPRVADLLAARESNGALPRAVLPELAQLCDVLDSPPPPEVEGLRRWAESVELASVAELPADLRAELREYQHSGVAWLQSVRSAGMGALLADDMGLGKTLQALCAMQSPSLVVAPTSVLHNWKQEIERFRPSLKVSTYHGSGRELDPEADVTLTTYALMRLDIEALAGRRWKSLVLDESQRIKNPESQVASAAFRLDAEFRISLSGTPVENRLEELWSQFHFLNRGLLGGRRHFRENYVLPVGAGDASAMERLRRRIRPFLLRRLKRDVAKELPPRTEAVLRCSLSREEREIYDTIRAATLKEVVGKLDQGGSVMAALEALLRLRQAACHGSLIPERRIERSAKVALLLESLETVVADGHKALVFSQWTSFLDLVQPELERAGIHYLRLDGSTRDREAVVDGFQNRDDAPVMLISLKAGGTGLNLTAADHIFLLDPWWNPAVEDQAADRAHRIGQERPVMVYRLVAMDTVEERILELQDRKRELAAQAIEGGMPATRLTRDDLMDLLG